ncbi:MAG: hypothetical protein WCI22_17360 [Actinomycetota bacterium]
MDVAHLAQQANRCDRPAVVERTGHLQVDGERVGAGQGDTPVGGQCLELADLVGDVLHRHVAELARRKPAAELHRVGPLLGCLAQASGVEQFASERTVGEWIDRHREPVVEHGRFARQQHLQPAAQEHTRWAAHRIDELIEVHRVERHLGQQPLRGGARRLLSGCAAPRLGGIEHGWVERERGRAAWPEGAWLQRPLVEPVTRVPHQPGSGCCWVDARRVGGGRHHVEQFHERHHERHGFVGGEIGAGAGDDEPIAGVEECVEQQLPRVVPRMAFAHTWVQAEDVVAIECAAPQRSLVETQQADDARRNTVLGEQRADRDRP